MKNILFPAICRKIGWALFVPATVLGVAVCLDMLCLAGVAETVVNDVIVVGMGLGAVFVVCSKENCEDEMVRSIRLASLLNALYVYVGLLIVCTIVLNGVEFFRFMSVNLVLFPLIFALTYSLEMRRYRKMSENEEQD